MNFKKSFFSSLSPRVLFTIAVISVIGIVSTLILEYNARKYDYMLLLEKQGNLFIKSLLSSTQNALITAEKIEEEINSRIVINLKLVNQIIEEGNLSPDKKNRLLDISGFEAIMLYNANGDNFFTISQNQNKFIIPNTTILALMQKTFQDTILTVYDEPEYETEQLTAFLKTRNGLLAAFINKNDIKSLKSTVGIGNFLKQFQSKENVEYVVIQNSFTIIAGSFGNYRLSTFSSDSILSIAFKQNKTHTRILKYDNKQIFEMISPFIVNKEPYGLLRLGLPMDEYEGLQSDMKKRYILASIVIAVLGIIFFSFLVNYRQRQMLNRDFGHLRNYTNTILENLSSGVISIKDNVITSINKKALEILELDYNDAFAKNINELPKNLNDVLILALNPSIRFSVNDPLKIIDSKNEVKLLAIQKNEFRAEDEKVTTVIIINEITEQKKLEEQLQRNQKLAAMSNLASSVAHEIKNPLNAIKLIIDLVKKKFKPSSDVEDYMRNINTVSLEIERVNKIIEQYLSLNRMPEITLQEENIKSIINEVCELFKSDFNRKNIQFVCNVNEETKIFCDKDQIKQALINLIKNAEESIEKKGEINISDKHSENYYELIIKDTGRGIPEGIMDKIFDLHFTTKKSGSGIGLFNVQQIILAHKSKIFVESNIGAGSIFIIQFPLIKKS